MKKHVILAALAVLTFACISFGQNRFEGYNIILDVPTTQRSTACALRYSAPSTPVTVTDLNGATPAKLRSCDGSSLMAGTPAMRADAATYKWCFEGEDKVYRITFAGDSYSGPVTYNVAANAGPGPTGSYNVKDFGAVGDGRTDDTYAIRGALAFLAAKNGGILHFPEGDYLVGGVPNFNGIAIPAGVTIQGVAGIHSGFSTNNPIKNSPSRITLSGSRRTLFKIGECVEKVAIKDIELFGVSQDQTIAVEGLGAYNSSQDFAFENVAFNQFWRGIYVHGLTQTNLSWQFDYVSIDRCRFIYNTDAGLYTNVINSDWHVQDSLFINPKRTATQNADSMRFERAGSILIENTFGGGFSTALGGTFINILDSGITHISHCGAEGIVSTLIYNEEQIGGAGDYSYPLTVVNSVFAAPMIFNARRTFVSTGNLYGPATFKADNRLRVYSTGDRFCYDGHTAGCRGPAKNNFDKATVIFMTGQPSEGQVQGHPAYFGTDVQFGAGVQMPSVAASALPTGKPNGTMVYCSNCRRATTPCSTGGSGAPAMVVNGQWSCL